MRITIIETTPTEIYAGALWLASPTQNKRTLSSQTRTGSSVKNNTRVFELRIEQGVEPIIDLRLCREANYAV